MRPSCSLRPLPLLIIFGWLMGILTPSPAPCAGVYRSSAHGDKTNGVSRKGLNDITLNDYAAGNCAHCHEQHASVRGAEPAPNAPAGPANYLGMHQEASSPGAEQSLCLHCHSLAGAANNQSSGAPDDIQSDIQKINNHDPTLSETSHRNKETLLQIAADKHIECTDCHNPHAAGKTLHHAHDGSHPLDPVTTATPTNTISATSPLFQATGAAQDYSGATSNWSQPSQGSYSRQNATKEYEICFKCHAGANSNVTTWGGAAAAAWTDVGLEFNPNNQAYHPIVRSLTAGNSAALAASQLVAPWIANAGTQTMYCSDCHESDSGLAGPHGSAIKWMLAGTNKAWPYKSTANNGDSDATPDYIDLTDTTGLFCRNCHPTPTSTNSVHTKVNHQTTLKGRCLNCHIRVPHGGKIPRLISAASTLTNLPNRYWPDGNGGNTINGAGNQPELERYTKSPPYGKNFCKTRGCVSPNHPGTMATESW